MTVQLPQRMGWDAPARASHFNGNIPPDPEDLAELADDRRRYRRATRALALATAAGLTGLQLEAFEIQAADAYARYATLTGGLPASGRLPARERS